ncbi:MAG TPA: hypothetical protein VF268_16420 [Gammaproteobacteria bacterium]
MTINTLALAGLGEQIRHRIRLYRKWYTLQAILFVMLGCFAVLLPLAGWMKFDLLFGGLLLAGGVSKALTAVGARLHAWSFVSAGLAVIAGLLLLLKSWPNSVELAELLAVFLLLEAVTEIFLAFNFKPARYWVRLLLLGLVTLLAAAGTWYVFAPFGLFYIVAVLSANLLLYGVILLDVAYQ